MASIFRTESTDPKLIKPVADMATDILRTYETHKPLIDAKVRVDFLLALAERDEDNQPVQPAIMVRGHQALGKCSIVGYKDRAKGQGDAEIMLDGDWWDGASTEEQRAVLDHELHHIMVPMRNGAWKTDDLGRPKLKLREHDFEFGPSTSSPSATVANSVECKMMKAIADNYGQLYWPEIAHEAQEATRIGRLDLHETRA